MEPWGDEGPPITWTFDQTKVEIGARIDLSGDVTCVDPERGACLLYTWPGRQQVRIFEGLYIDDDVEHVSIFGAQLVDGQGMAGFIVDKHCEVLPHRRLHLSDLYKVVELCSGMGVMTQGLTMAGLSTQLANELRPKMAAAFQALHPDIAMVTGDICDPHTVVEIFRQYGRSSILAAGFSCQPFSTGGKCLGVNDRRSDTLKGVLDAAKMLRCPVVVLECVSKAGSNRYVRKVIETFSRGFQFHLSEQILQLEDCWVTRRERWWCILTAPCFGCVTLPPLPMMPFPAKVKHILPQPFECDDEDFVVLRLTEREMRLLLELVPNYKDLYLPANGKCPTALHAWGSQFDKCPCECREAFSMDTLRSRGVYGVVVASG